MVPNILQFTEQFDNAYWANNATVTPNTDAPPKGVQNYADQVADISVIAQENIVAAETIADDSSDWLMSLFVKKEAVVARFPQFLLILSGGSSVLAGISMDSSTGQVVDSDGGSVPADAKGVVDYNSRFWRVWWRKANNGSGNTLLRMFIFPTVADVLGDANQSVFVGSFVIWGANATNSSVLQPYQPNPPYQFNLIR